MSGSQYRDGGFLELVRYGVRAATDALVQNSLHVIDEVLKVVTPSGACWRRYNHDNYGQRQDGEAFESSGVGRGWPLLAGERGHYEIAAGGLAAEQILSMEGFSTPTHLLPEQVWDEPDRLEQGLRLGRPTGVVVPLLWAHAEYVKLLRATADRKVYDRITEVEERYQGAKIKTQSQMFWSFAHPAPVSRKGEAIRLMAGIPFEVRWTHDGWKTVLTQHSIATKLGVHFADLAPGSTESAGVEFTFLWSDENRWEGKNFAVEIQ